MSFGTSIPVIGLNNGFLGNVSRSGERVIAARQVLATTPTNLFFGDTAVIVPDSTGGTYQSVRDFIAGAGTFTAALFAGIAVRNVKTQPGFPLPPGTAQTGGFFPGSIGEVLERGSITVACLVGTPVAENPAFVRIALNGAFPAGVVGGIEAVADGSNTVSLASIGVVFRTGVLDANNVAEITLKNRVAA